MTPELFEKVSCTEATLDECFPCEAEDFFEQQPEQALKYPADDSWMVHYLLKKNIPQGLPQDVVNPRGDFVLMRLSAQNATALPHLMIAAKAKIMTLTVLFFLVFFQDTIP